MSEKSEISCICDEKKYKEIKFTERVKEVKIVKRVKEVKKVKSVRFEN